MQKALEPLNISKAKMYDNFRIFVRLKFNILKRLVIVRQSEGSRRRHHQHLNNSVRLINNISFIQILT